MTRIVHTVAALATLTLAACEVDVASKPADLDPTPAPVASSGDAGGSITVTDPSNGGPFGVGVRYVEDEGTLGTVEFTLWYPAVPGSERAHWSHSTAVLDAPVVDHGDWPVVVLSHGEGEAPESLSYLADHLVSTGYVVVAPSHGDGTSRLDDLALGIDMIESLNADATDPLGGRVATHRVAALGHAEGALSAEDLASVEGDPRVAVAISVSPPGHDVAELDVPVLILGGSEEGSCDLEARAAEVPRSALVVIDDAGPRAFTDACAMGMVRTAQDCLAPKGASSAAEVQRRVRAWVSLFLSNELPGERRVRI